MREGIPAVAEAVRQAASVAVCCHLNPDGDTIGTALALRLALLRLGKRVEVFCRDRAPDLVAMLPGAETVRSFESLREGERFDLLFTVDVSDKSRLGEGAFERMAAVCGDTCQVDHHETNPLFCRVNCVDGSAPAAGLILRELLAALGVPLDREMAECLYAAIATDTGNFSFGNVTPEAYRTAAELLEAGLPLAEMNRRLFVLQPEAQVRLTGRAIGSMRVFHGGEAAVMTLSRKDFEDCGARTEHADTVVNRALAVQGVRLAALLREDGGRTKASLRSVAPDTVSGIAAAFGGGGHAQAAGCTLDLPLDEAAERIAETFRAALDGGKA
ncbi:MAG: DHH family phosphoesterase [Clostridia bacterium]|nr:DHH family phosphoesterase [Clostridia bacterium]